jgi:hypothetical protein
LELRKNHGVLSDVLQVACAGLWEFIACLLHPPQPFCACVMSIMKSGDRSGAADSMNVFQSARVLGEKILVPTGQLFLSSDLLTFKQPVHLMREPAEYLPVSVTSLH